MSVIIRVVDLSEWTGDVSIEHARLMFEQGVRGVILQAWGSGHIPGRRNEFFHQSVDAFRQAGITKIDPYIWPPSDWQAALAWIGDYKRFCAGAAYLDVEAGAGVNDAIINGVRAAGWEPRIYASPSSWSEIMGNTTRYADLKLWLARYLLRFQRPDGFYNPGFDVVFPRDAFGGFTVGGWGVEGLVGWQTTGTVPDFCGESVDSSVFLLSAFGEEGLTMAQYDELKAMIEAVRVGAASTVTSIDRRADAQAARIAAAGLYLEVETKLTMGLAVPIPIRDQVRWLLGGRTPRITSSRELLIVLYRYAAARALRGDPVDDETIRRLRYAVR